MLKNFAGAAFGKGPLALAMAAGLGMAPASISLAAAAEQPMTFYACQKDAKVIPGTIQGDVKPKCNGGASLVSWPGAHHHAMAVGGVVAFNGAILAGQGFTVQWPGAGSGKYLVTFAPGVVAKGAAMSVTPYFAPAASNHLYTNPVVTDAKDLADGSRYYEITMSATTPNENPSDSGFMFVVAPTQH